MRNASGHDYGNASFTVDLAMGQIPHSIERISSFYYYYYYYIKYFIVREIKYIRLIEICIQSHDYNTILPNHTISGIGSCNIFSDKRKVNKCVMLSASLIINNMN